MTEQEHLWRQERDRILGIGSSEAAIALGLKPFDITALQLYEEKLGLRPRREGASLKLRSGKYLEPFVAHLYAEATGRIVQQPPAPVLRHPEHDWCFASLDRVTACGRIVECKTAGFRALEDGWGEPGTDQVPDYYLIQCQHQMAVSGLDVADVPCLFTAWMQLEIYTVPRNEALIALLLDSERAFMECLWKQTPPPIDWTAPGVADLVRCLFRPVPGTEAPLSAECQPWADRYEYLGQAIKQQEQERAGCQGRLILACGNHAKGVLPDGRVIHPGKPFRITKGRRA